MSEIVDQALRSYQSNYDIDPSQIGRLRERTFLYIGKLISAGRSDPEQLKEYAHAYLRELHKGPDRQFTGC